MKKILVWFAGLVAEEIKQRLLADDVKVAVLNLQPGDRIILRHQRVLTEVGYERLKSQIEEFFPGHKAVILEEGMEFGVGRIEERPDDSEPGIPDGARFYCPSCKSITTDSWFTNPRIGDRVKCPMCKQGFEVLTNPDDSNTVLVRP